MSKQLSPADEIRTSLMKMEDQFKQALPGHINPKKFIRTAMTAIQTSPQLLKCDRRSLYGELVKCSQAGLMPNGEEAALVPFKDQAKFMPMVKGLMKLARNSGEIKSINSNIVYKNDDFEYWIDSDGEHIKHKPNLFSERGDTIAVYAMAVTKDGGTYIEVLTNEDILAIEKTSRGNNTPWKGPFRSEMIRKSAIKRLYKRLPSSTDLDMAMDSDNDFYDLKSDKSANESEKNINEPERPAETSSRLRDLVGESDDGEVINVQPSANNSVSEDEVPI
jgi:recombination protein RecT